jgi:TRAP-type C4-dicarboxylate transport system permease small subunit
MVALTFADVIGRRLFGVPIYGAHDITEHLMGVLVFIGLPLVTAASGHLAVDLFDRFILSPSMSWWRMFIALLIALIMGLLAYLFHMQALDAGEISEVSQALNIPREPVFHLMSICCGFAAVAALVAGFAKPIDDPEAQHAKEAL